MQVSTEAVVLFYRKYNDSSVILHLFTEHMGRIAVMVYGISGKKRNKLAYLQPLNIIDVIIDTKPQREIQVLKEISPAHHLNSISADMHKSVQAVFIAEVLGKTLSEEHAEGELFTFVKASVQMLNELAEYSSVFHVAFLIKYSRFLGFSFKTDFFENNYYDYKAGLFLSQKPLHPYFVSEETYLLMDKIASVPYYHFMDLGISSKDENKIFATILKMYDINIPGFRTLKSLQVMRELLN